MFVDWFEMTLRAINAYNDELDCECRNTKKKWTNFHNIGCVFVDWYLDIYIFMIYINGKVRMSSFIDSIQSTIPQKNEGKWEHPRKSSKISMNILYPIVPWTTSNKKMQVHTTMP